MTRKQQIIEALQDVMRRFSLKVRVDTNYGLDDTPDGATVTMRDPDGLIIFIDEDLNP